MKECFTSNIRSNFRKTKNKRTKINKKLYLKAVRKLMLLILTILRN